MMVSHATMLLAMLCLVVAISQQLIPVTAQISKAAVEWRVRLLNKCDKVWQLQYMQTEKNVTAYLETLSCNDCTGVYAKCFETNTKIEQLVSEGDYCEVFRKNDDFEQCIAATPSCFEAIDNETLTMTYYFQRVEETACSSGSEANRTNAFALLTEDCMTAWFKCHSIMSKQHLTDDEREDLDRHNRNHDACAVDRMATGGFNKSDCLLKTGCSELEVKVLRCKASYKALENGGMSMHKIALCLWLLCLTACAFATPH